MHLDVVEIAQCFEKEATALNIVQILAERFTRNRETLEVQQILELDHHRRHSTCVPEILHRVESSRLCVGEH